jgi:hypothetical protein
MNKRGEKPESLQAVSEKAAPSGPVDLLAGDSITRFDKSKKKKKKKKPQQRPAANTSAAQPQQAKPHKAQEQKHDESK